MENLTDFDRAFDLRRIRPDLGLRWDGGMVFGIRETYRNDVIAYHPCIFRVMGGNPAGYPPDEYDIAEFLEMFPECPYTTHYDLRRWVDDIRSWVRTFPLIHVDYISASFFWAEVRSRIVIVPIRDQNPDPNGHYLVVGLPGGTSGPMLWARLNGGEVIESWFHPAAKALRTSDIVARAFGRPSLSFRVYPVVSA